MIRVSIITGDALGGPHVQSDLDLDREIESLTDDEVSEWTSAVRSLFVAGHGRQPESIIVAVSEVAA